MLARSASLYGSFAITLPWWRFYYVDSKQRKKEIGAVRCLDGD